MKKVIIKEAGGKGMGVFAAQDIKAGENICTMRGKQVGYAWVMDIATNGGYSIDDPLQVEEKEWLLLDEPYRIFNHSCAPNAAIRKRNKLFAIRDISIGEEISYDYSLTVAPNIPPEWSMQCLCGSPNCRKTIGDILSIPMLELLRYKRIGALQRYMKRILQ